MSKFTDAINAYLGTGAVVAVGCRGSACEWADGDENHQCETHFSWTACDSCGSTFGGDRYPAFLVFPGQETEPIELDGICIDCAMYHANGDEPETWAQHPHDAKAHMLRSYGLR